MRGGLPEPPILQLLGLYPRGPRTRTQLRLLQMRRLQQRLRVHLHLPRPLPLHPCLALPLLTPPNHRSVHRRTQWHKGHRLQQHSCHQRLFKEFEELSDFYASMLWQERWRGWLMAEKSRFDQCWIFIEGINWGLLYFTNSQWIEGFELFEVFWCLGICLNVNF